MIQHIEDDSPGNKEVLLMSPRSINEEVIDDKLDQILQETRQKLLDHSLNNSEKKPFF